MAQQGEQRTVQAVQIALDIIDVMQECNGARVTEIAEELGRSKGTVHSHLTTLVENEYVVKDGETYRLGLRYIELGESVKDRLGLYPVIRDELDELADETGELAQFATDEHGRAVYLYRTEGENAVQTASSIGMREHLHCISLGKAILAHYPEEQVDEIVDKHGLPEATQQTITDREELHAELESIREQGYALDNQEKIEGLRCVAAPVLSGDEVLGAVSVSGPSSRMTGDRWREELPEKVIRSANVIEINAKFS